MAVIDYGGDDLSSFDYLEHYGVKGMKWGVRKSRAPVSSSKKKRRVSRKSKSAPKRKKLSEMTDEELDAVIRRKNKERQYKELTQPAYIKYAKKAGKALVGGVLFNAGKKALTSYTSDQMKLIISKGASYVKDAGPVMKRKVVALAISNAIR